MKNRRWIIPIMVLCLLLSGCSQKLDMNAADHVYSHRGASGEEIEHTFAAYDLAILYGSQYIEQDIVLSGDGTLYVSHDLSAERMCGVDKTFETMTDKEIDALSVKDGQKILRLSDVFDKYADSVNYVIELKSGGKTAEAFAEIVRKYGNEKRIIVQSFDADVLKTVENDFPDMPKMFLITEQEVFENSMDLAYVDILSVNKKLMNQENCDLAHQHGKIYNVWTLNTTEEIVKAIELGVDTYFTNYTAKALALENQYRKP